ncbi:MAG: type I DNA topoisomerase [Rickettsiaceae bacterium]|nr:type I DNA topoisomerase [Rickettsiaceae bacterium]
MKLVIVESPTKAKTINKYLGQDYKVIACFGHVRALPSKKGSVDPENDFAVTYEIVDKATKHVQDLIRAAKTSTEILLATDPDREGEAISWHVAEILKENLKSKKELNLNRITFNEITKTSLANALKNPRAIDIDLVTAQQARQALDYLVGFSLSPILWTKIPGCRSAGRVQSVALKLICEREYEIEKFINREYWDITINFITDNNVKVEAKLISIDNKKLDKFDIPNAEEADKLVQELGTQNFTVFSVERKEQRRNPPAPFTTSSLQQEGSKKLGFSTKKTMQLAQKLYEGIDIAGETTGLITYMRTDGVSISDEALVAIRKAITNNFGDTYLPSSPRIYKTKTKNAQEAHEAIRPTDITLKPQDLYGKIDNDLLKLYTMIWQRTIASQMEQAILDLVSIDIQSLNTKFIARATGHTIKFDGFYRIYSETKDEGEEEEQETKLPPLEKGQSLEKNEVLPKQHFTEPPPRYTEASLIKKLEELGIGRPSTYTSIISVLQDRNYVKLEKKRFISEDHGRIVTAFLQHYFAKYLEYDFTANLENELDSVSSGKLAWKELLRDFWTGFNENVNHVKQYKITDIIETLDKDLEVYLFQKKASDNIDPRLCKKCSKGRLNLRFGKFGPFIACSEYPNCNYSRKLSANNDDDNNSGLEQDNMLIGDIDGKNVYLRKGQYGHYLQLGETNGDVKRVSLPATYKVDNMNMENASLLLSLPKKITIFPDTNEEICLASGRFGIYLKCGSNSVSIGKEEPFSLSAERAIELVRAKLAKPASEKTVSRYTIAAKKPTAKKSAPKEKTVAVKKSAPKEKTVAVKKSAPKEKTVAVKKSAPKEKTVAVKKSAK